MPGKIAVEVAYALPEKQYLQRVTLQEGATVEEAIRASGLLELRTDIDLTKNKVGIYSRPAKLSDIVHDGDRVEIYRPLIADPKELRRQRATLLFVTTQRRFVINVVQHTATVKGQRQRLLRYTFMTRLLAEDIEPGIRTKWIGHQRCTQCVRNLLLRHANTYFGYVVSGQIVPLVDVRTVNHSLQSGTACGQHQ